MKNIIPYLWFENQAEEAANYYISIFSGKNSRINNIAYNDEITAEVSGSPAGSVLSVEFELEGQSFGALNGGPEFKFTPAVSFFVSCATVAELEELWFKLIEGGSVLMALDKYPFSEKYGWLSDKFGVSWQLNLAPYDQKITPALLFVGDQHGKAEEAMNKYVSLFDNSKIEMIERYEAGEGDTVGTIKHAKFSLDGNKFIAMDSGFDHKFGFSQATSFLINCDTQAEVDKFWEELSRGGEIQQCGWLRDKYGVTWQVAPTLLDKLLNDPDREKAGRVMKAMLQMIKIESDKLQAAYDNE